MNALFWLILVSLALGSGALALFLWALRSGQYEDLEGAAQRILFDDVPPQ
jgi:cbb3-type cytochrome oxidase maturation protein